MPVLVYNCLMKVVVGRLWLSVPVAVLAACMLHFSSSPVAVAVEGSVGGGEALVMTVDDAISPAVADYVVRGLAEARRSGSSLVLIRLNTPGGLDSAMRDIVQEILDMPVPVVVAGMAPWCPCCQCRGVHTYGLTCGSYGTCY